MNAVERRKQILELLDMDIKPVSAANLAERFEVSRQVIVGDIALLRAGGENIVATPKGYILYTDKHTKNAQDTYVIACCHDKSSLQQELYTIVDNGGELLNISVDHPLYGTISQPLSIASRYDADAFINKVAMSGAALLSSLTEGVHMHTMRCKDPNAYRRILMALREQGILYVK